MIINFSELKDLENLHFELDLDLSDVQIDDALIKQLNTAKGTLDIVLVEDNCADLIFNVTYNVDYLDARTLEPLVVDFNLEDDIMLTNNQNKAIELDIDFVEEDEIDIIQLLSELILVNIPFNYSQAPQGNVDAGDDENTYHPFAGVFNKEE